ILFIQLTDLLDQKQTESETTKQKIDLEALQKKSVLLLRPMIRVMARQFLFVIVGFIALIVPGIIMLVWYAFSQTALVIDEKKDMEALAFSKSLGKGRLLCVGYRLIAGPFLVGFIFSIVIIILFSLISIFTGTDLVQTITENKIPAWMNLLQSSLEIFTMPLIAIYMVFLYKDLKKNPLEKTSTVVV
ncbi:MAG: hypothetical protein AAB664_00215, partial [Patescibacteria group bacterium]